MQGLRKTGVGAALPGSMGNQMCEDQKTRFGEPAGLKFTPQRPIKHLAGLKQIQQRAAP